MPIPVPKMIQAVGEELAVVWSDGLEAYLPLSTVRRLCPCAACAGERDLLGRVHKPPSRPLTAESFRVAGTAPVGGYAVQVYWADGHSDGLYPYAVLRAWCEEPPQLPPLTVAPLLPTI